MLNCPARKFCTRMVVTTLLLFSEQECYRAAERFMGKHKTGLSMLTPGDI